MRCFGTWFFLARQDRGFVSRINLNASHVLLISVAHSLQSLSEREGDFSMMIPVFLIGVIKSRLWCLSSPTDEINFP